MPQCCLLSTWNLKQFFPGFTRSTEMFKKHYCSLENNYFFLKKTPIFLFCLLKSDKCYGYFIHHFSTYVYRHFPLESSWTPSWDVKNCACRNESILIMQIWVSLIGMFCFINYILLSEVKLYLNNFTEIVTKIFNCVPCMPLLI